MRSKKTYLYLSLFCIHCFIALVAFLHFRLHPGEILFSDIGDGLKNIYNLETYVKSPVTSEGILKYNGFQYPYGDYVFYTDNTPLFAIPFRFFCQYIYDLSAYTVTIFYTVLVLNIILCGLLMYYLLRRLAGDNVISYIMALVLPWVNMQVGRMYVGHYAFSFSSLILLAICLMWLWHKHIYERRKLYVVGACMCLLAFCSFLAQGYYLAILTIFQASMLFFYGYAIRRQVQGRFTMVASVVCAVVVGCMVFLLLEGTDKYLSLRRENASGYDWMEMKTRFTALFSHYSFQNIAFPISSGTITDEHEKAAYLGNVGLYAVLVFGILMLALEDFRKFVIKIQRDFFSDPLKLALVMGSLIMLFISFGENYYTESPPEKGLHFINILNPFFYIHLVTKRVEQFRALVRFMWPFYYVFNIWIIYTIVAVYHEYGRKVKVAVIASVLFLGGAELYDCTNRDQRQGHEPNHLSAAFLDEVRPKHVDWRQYQAILPIPYYTVGTEEYDYILDDDNDWSDYSYRLAKMSGLPLMSCKMSRTPLIHTISLLHFVAYDSIPDMMRARMNSKPVLVAVNKRLVLDSNAAYIPREERRAVLYWNATLFAKRNHLQAIDSLGDVVYYNWYPPVRS